MSQLIVKRQSCILSVLLILTFGLPATSQAKLGFDVEVGLDSGTKAFLLSLGDVYREKYTKAMQDTFDRLDQSVVKTFELSSKLLVQAQDAASCQISNGEKLPKHAINGVFRLDPKYADDLYDQLEKARNKTGWNTPPQKIVRNYANFDYNASGAQCLTREGDLLRSSIVNLRNQARDAFILWSRLDGQCTDSASCYDMVSHSLTETLKNSDKIDKDKINADARFLRIKAPPVPGGFFNSYKWEPYQIALIEMLRINDELEIVVNDRIGRGRISYNDYASSIHELDELLAGLNAPSQIPQWPNIKKANDCNIGYVVAGKINGVSIKLAVVENLRFLSESELRKQKSRVEEISQRALSLKNTAPHRNDIKNDGTKCEAVIVFGSIL